MAWQDCHVDQAACQRCLATSPTGVAKSTSGETHPWEREGERKESSRFPIIAEDWNYEHWLIIGGEDTRGGKMIVTPPNPQGMKANIRFERHIGKHGQTHLALHRDSNNELRQNTVTWKVR
uniref:Uncharacterized protein n=1 Tax=Oryza brachyantha TaxID=4533 RepID=J3MIG0_ORYBR